MQRIILIAIAAVMTSLGTAFADVQLNAAVVPLNRSVNEGGTVTFFSTVINSGDQVATNCRVEADPENRLGSDMDYQRTDAVNQPVGTVNTPFSIPAGGSQSLVLAIRPQATVSVALTELYVMTWRCDESEVRSRFGLSTPFIRLSATGNPTEDVIMTLVTLSADGVMRMVDNGRRGVAAGSATNIGDPGPVNFWPSYPGYYGSYFSRDAHLRSLTICFTDPSGQCLSPA